MSDRRQILGDFIEAVRAAGRTPRLFIDARRKDVEIPSFLRAHGTQLVIDLDPTFPLDLDLGERLSATLAFAGSIHRCAFPWEAIYAVVDGNRGIAGAPPDELAEDLRWVEKQGRPRFTVVKGGKA